MDVYTGLRVVVLRKEFSATDSDLINALYNKFWGQCQGKKAAGATPYERKQKMMKIGADGLTEAMKIDAKWKIEDYEPHWENGKEWKRDKIGARFEVRHDDIDFQDVMIYMFVQDDD